VAFERKHPTMRPRLFWLRQPTLAAASLLSARGLPFVDKEMLERRQQLRAEPSFLKIHALHVVPHLKHSSNDLRSR